MKTIRIFSLSVALLLPLFVAAQTEPVTHGQRVFACGHSFHFAIPPILDETAKAAGFADHQIVGISSIGGSKVIQHWNAKAQALLATGKVDVVTTTPIYLPDDGMEKFAQAALAANPGARVTIQEFWLPFDQYEPRFYNAPRIPQPKQVDHNAATVTGLRQMHQRYFDEMDAHIAALNAKLGKQVLFVVPVGQAVIALREKIIAGAAPGLKNQADLFTDPLGHPKPVLQALIADCHFAVIYRRTPVGLPRLKNQKWDDELNRLLQELAWDAVTHHPLSGVRAK